MGTDIHLYVERREPGGRWITCDAWEKSTYAEENGRLLVPYAKHFYSGRNYDLFAILADVRNGHGFAGVKTGQGFVPIAVPKGWPEDCCAELKAVGEEIDHTPSWLTVAELMAYDWTRTTTKQGIVTPQQWALWKLRGLPEEYSGGVSGGTVRHISNAAMEAAALPWKEDLWALFHDRNDAVKTLIASVDDRPYASVYTQVSWEIPYYEAGSEFLSATLPRLWRLGHPEHVRIVFYFDS